MANVKFLSVKLRSTFDALETKDNLALYWIEETKQLYKGNTLFGTGSLATEKAAGLLSPEDYVALKTLINNSSGMSNLSPVDGSIIITTEDNGAAIGVGLSTVGGNMLSIKDDGLYVAETKVPEYSIEKQSDTEDGYSATYKLKKTIDGVSTYVGDSINIARDMVLQGATLETVIEPNAPYGGAEVGDPYIDMMFNDAEQSHIYIPVKGLVDVYTSGEGIEIVDGKISVKIAENSHGLVAVDGALTINLATRKTDGTMSKEDKTFIDSIPYAYEARKYDVSDTPIGTLVNYRGDEIRIMCPAGTIWTKQNVGAGGNTNCYYVALKTYAPSNDVVGYMEHLGNQSDAEILTNLSTDQYGRRYQTTWLSVALYDEGTGIWTYYGANSSMEKYIGWDYKIDWYNIDNIKIHTDSIRINLSNENCHDSIKSASAQEVSKELQTVKADVAAMNESYTWGEI